MSTAWVGVALMLLCTTVLVAVLTVVLVGAHVISP